MRVRDLSILWILWIIPTLELNKPKSQKNRNWQTYSQATQPGLGLAICEWQLSNLTGTFVHLSVSGLVHKNSEYLLMIELLSAK